MQPSSIEAFPEQQTNDKPKTLLLVDGSNLVFRMYFALESSGMTSPSGKPSWAIFGFFKALFDVIEQQKPTTIIAAFDTKQPTFRHEAFDFYKANRPDEMPETLALQWPEIKKGLELVGMSLVELPGYEADDLIGTLALQGGNSGWNVLILSGDKDNLQLVDDKVKVLMPGPKGIQLVGRDEVIVKMGVPPEQVVDFKALCGDSSDNIPGVAGIGPKTAVKLLEEYGSLDDVYANLDKITSASVKKKLAEGRESAFDSRFLAQIKTDCPIAYPFENLTHPLNPNFPELVAFLHEYKLASMEKRLPKIFEKIGLNEKSQESFKQIGLFAKSTYSTAVPTTAERDKKNSEQAAESKSQIKLEINRTTVFEEAHLKRLLEEWANSPALSLDLETDGLNTWECNIVGWSFGWTYPPTTPLTEGANVQYNSCYIPTGHNYLGAPDQLSNEVVAKTIADFLASWKGQLVIQNTKFEYKILKRYGITLPETTVDTMLSSYVENPDQSHGLKNQAYRVFSYQMAQIDELIGPKGKKQKTMNEVSVEKCSDYACDDAALTLALYEHYKTILNDQQIKLWLEVESPLAVLLSKMELRGVYINANKLNGLSSDLTWQINKYESEILEKLGAGHFNLNSSQQLAQALVQKGFKLSKTDNGQLSTDSKILHDLAERDESGVIEQIIEYRVLTKLRSTYTDSLPRQINTLTNRLHGEFNQALTSTGRLSSSNPNLQNIPIKNQQYGKLIRASFEAETGNILLSADYSQIELRILAHFTEDPTLIDAFNQGQDIHLRTAAEIFEVSPNEVTGEMRRLGKTLNFALIYQQGTYATARQLGISNKEATSFIEKYFERFPRIKPFMEKTLQEASENGYVETIWGRRRYFKNLTSRVPVIRKMDERAAFNAPLQGSSADLMKMAMLKVNEQIEAQKLEAKLLLQVHDEIIVEAKHEQADQIKEILLKEMVLGQPFKVPIQVQVGMGPNWAECK